MQSIKPKTRLFAFIISLIMAVSVFWAVPFNATASAILTVPEKSRFATSVTFSTLDSIDNSNGNSIINCDPTFSINHRNNPQSDWYYYETIKEAKYNGTVANTVASLYDGKLDTQLMSSYHKWVTQDPEIAKSNTENYGSDMSKYKSDIASMNVGRKNGTQCYDVVYELPKAEMFSAIVVAGASRNLRMGDFQVFVSDTKEDLFNEKNVIMDCLYSEELINTTSRVWSVKLSSAKSGKYFALRIYNPYIIDNKSIICSDTDSKASSSKLFYHSYVRLNEFNVYRKDPYDAVTLNNTNSGGTAFSEKIENYIKNNLKNAPNMLAGKSPESIELFRDGATYTDFSENVQNTLTGEYLNDNEHKNYATLTGEDYAVGTDISPKSPNSKKGGFIEYSGGKYKLIDDESRMYYQLVYRLDNPLKIKHFVLAGRSNYKSAVSHYKVSFAVNKEDLFKSSKSTYTTEIYINRGTLSSLTFKDYTDSYSYVGIRIICGMHPDVDTNTYKDTNSMLRLNGIYLSGAYPEGEDAYLRNLNKFTNYDDSFFSTTKVETAEKADMLNKYPQGCEYNISAEPSILKNGKRESFIKWEIEYNDGTQKCESEELTVKTKICNIKAATVYYGTTTKKVNITFLDKSGNKIYSSEVYLGFAPTLEDIEKANAKVPDICGYTKATQGVDVGSRTKNYQAWSMDVYEGSFGGDVSVTPLYNVAQDEYTVKFNGQVYEAKAKFNQKMCIVEPNDKSVLWTVNGVKTYVGNIFNFYVCGDMNITTSTGTSAEIISLYNPAGVKSATVDGENIGAFASFRLPKGATLVSCGILMRGNDYLTDTDYTGGAYTKLKTDVSGTQKADCPKHSNTEFMATVSGVGKNRTRVIRAYVSYIPEGSKTATTSYSNVITVKK